jgi:RNA polymerase sigma-70 factor (ECF subfamily)
MEKDFVALVKENNNLMHDVCNTYAALLARDDLVQEILLRAWSSYSRFKWNSKFSTWFYAICRNVCIDNVRRQKSKPLIVPITTDIAESIAYKTDLFEKIKQGLRYETVINNLPPDEQQIIFMYMDGLTFKEMQAITGIDENTLRVRVNRIKKRLILRYGK